MIKLGEQVGAAFEIVELLQHEPSTAMSDVVQEMAAA
jgi:hypothetical protein